MWQETVTEHGRMCSGDRAERLWDWRGRIVTSLLNGRGRIWSLGPEDLSLASLQAVSSSSNGEDYSWIYFQSWYKLLWVLWKGRFLL